uniref:F-box domain-containing protein n=1 Tax=Mastacembelus armatus TaxID=205130 RepID=A0A3Q3KF78_9TELE
MEELPQLPPEVWVYVFSFLSTEEKHAVRTCCRYLRNLVDHPSLWRDYTVMLSDLRRYTYGFWETLQKRNLTRVAVRHLRRKEWRRLVILLPTLTAIVFMDGGRFYKQKYLDILTRFPNLRDLGVRNAAWNEPMLGRQLTQQVRERLTHLSVCNVRLTDSVDFINAVSHLVNLRFLLFHQHGEMYGLDTVRPVPRSVFHNLLLSLKKLKHLSWGMKGEPLELLPDDYFSPADPNQPGAARYDGPALTSLELVDYPENILSGNALTSLTSLRSLTVHYKYAREGKERRLGSWLEPLHQLETLTIIDPEV